MKTYKRKMLQVIKDMKQEEQPTEFKASSPSKVAKQHGRAFSLPAGPAFTCPGATEACVSCYATKGRHIFSNVQKLFSRNWLVMQRFEKKKDLVGCALALAKILPKAGLFRIHESGDFHSQFAVNVWALVAQSNPHIDFYAYTRSFHLNFLPLLDNPNFLLWASTDSYNKDAAKKFVTENKSFKVKHAYGPWGHEEALPEHSFVCPATNGKLEMLNACTNCQLCIIPDRTKKNVVFLAH